MAGAGKDGFSARALSTNRRVCARVTCNVAAPLCSCSTDEEEEEEVKETGHTLRPLDSTPQPNSSGAFCSTRVPRVPGVFANPVAAQNQCVKMAKVIKLFGLLCLVVTIGKQNTFPPQQKKQGV